MEISSLGIHNNNSNPNPSVELLSGTRENIGRWNATEHELFLQGLAKYGKDWKAIAAEIPTRSVVQVRTHAQKYFQKTSNSNPRTLISVHTIRRRDPYPVKTKTVDSDSSTSPEVSDASPALQEKPCTIVIEQRREPTNSIRLPRNHEVYIDQDIINSHGPYVSLSPFEIEDNDFHDDIADYSFDSN